MLYVLQRMLRLVTTVQNDLGSVNAEESRLNLFGRRGVKLVAMATQAAGDKRDLPAEWPKDAAAAPEPEMNPLQRLIQERLRERGWSYGEVARRGGLPRSTVYTLATTRNLTRPPRPATIDALAKRPAVPVVAVR